jgi:nitrite reductase/ring-hydroxylating ferredoxin subunit
MAKVALGEVHQFEEGTVRIVSVGNRQVGVIRWEGKFYAINNHCPHQGGPVCEGHLGPRLEASARGELQVDREKPTLACAWHGWEFDVRDGSSLWDRRYRLKTYSVEVEDGQVVMYEVA